MTEPRFQVVREALDWIADSHDGKIEACEAIDSLEADDWEFRSTSAKHFLVQIDRACAAEAKAERLEQALELIRDTSINPKTIARTALEPQE